MSLELLFLGTGTSAGVPIIGCDCDVCRSTDPRDKRARPSVLIRYKDDRRQTRHILIDATAELRMAAIEHRINRLDAILITHAHADHIFGLDDVRRYNAIQQQPIDLYTDQTAYDTLGRIFEYIFEPHKNVNQSFVARLQPRLVQPGVSWDMHGARWTPLALLHGRLPILGFRVDYHGQSLAYCTDVSSFPPETYPLLENLDVLVIDALRYRHHPTHLTIDQALVQIEHIRGHWTG